MTETSSHDSQRAAQPGAQSPIQAATSDSAMSEAMLRSMQKALETMQIGVTIAGVDGTIVYVNPADARMHGYDPAELVGRNIGIFSRPEDRQPLAADRLRDITSWQRESWNRRKDGSVFPVRLLSDVVYDASGQPLGIVTTCENITERKRSEGQLLRSHQQLTEERQKLESQLQQAQKLEAVGQLTGGIAHDFNNILSVILGNAELVKAGLPPEATAQRELMDDILQAGRGGAEMVASLLGFSRRAELRMQPVDLPSALVDMREILSRLVPESIEIRLDVASGSKAVRADTGALQQIVMNLVTNARDAMPDGGTIRIELNEVTLDASHQAQHPWIEVGRYACLTVTDTGAGMNAETLERVFEPFFTTKPPGRGTGLGMAMIYGLVKQHRGFVHVESTVGRGTRVRLYFPVVDAAPAAVADTGPVSARCGNETILLAEDDEALRRTAVRALTTFGYRVLTAANGVEALAVYREHEAEIDLVITDLVMPKMDGLDLYERVRADGKPVRFLFVSGYTEREVKGRASLGAELPLLRKPWTLTDLAAHVARVLEAEPS